MLPRKIKFFIYLILLLLPFTIIYYQIINDRANDPPVIHKTSEIFPLTDNSILLIELGVLEFTSDLFISVTINRTDGVLPRFLLLDGNDYNNYLRGSFNPLKNENVREFTGTMNQIWLNVTIPLEVEYKLVIESTPGKTTIISVAYWQTIPKFIERETLSVLFYTFLYYIAIGFGFPKIQTIRLKRYREKQNKEREIREEQEYQNKKNLR